MILYYIIWYFIIHMYRLKPGSARRAPGRKFRKRDMACRNSWWVGKTWIDMKWNAWIDLSQLKGMTWNEGIESHELTWMNWNEWIKMNDLKWRNWIEWINMNELKWRNWNEGNEGIETNELNWMNDLNEWTEWIDMNELTQMNWDEWIETNELKRMDWHEWIGINELKGMNCQKCSEPFRFLRFYMKSSSRDSLVHILSTSSSKSGPKSFTFFNDCMWSTIWWRCGRQRKSSPRYSLVPILSTSSPKSGPRLSVFHDFCVKSSYRNSLAHNLWTAFAHLRKTETLQRWPETLQRWPFAPDRSHLPTTWWCDWHDNVVDMMIEMMIWLPWGWDS